MVPGEIPGQGRHRPHETPPGAPRGRAGAAAWGDPPDPTPAPRLLALAARMRAAMVEKPVEYRAHGAGDALGETVYAIAAAQVALAPTGVIQSVCWKGDELVCATARNYEAACRMLEADIDRLQELLTELLVHDDHSYGPWTRGMKDRVRAAAAVSVYTPDVVA